MTTRARKPACRCALRPVFDAGRVGRDVLGAPRFNSDGQQRARALAVGYAVASRPSLRTLRVLRRISATAFVCFASLARDAVVLKVSCFNAKNAKRQTQRTQGAESDFATFASRSLRSLRLNRLRVSVPPCETSNLRRRHLAESREASGGGSRSHLSASELTFCILSEGLAKTSERLLPAASRSISSAKRANTKVSFSTTQQTTQQTTQRVVENSGSCKFLVMTSAVWRTQLTPMVGAPATAPLLCGSQPHSRNSRSEVFKAVSALCGDMARYAFPCDAIAGKNLFCSDRGERMKHAKRRPFCGAVARAARLGVSYATPDMVSPKTSNNPNSQESVYFEEAN